jgi:hypothetical protein
VTLSWTGLAGATGYVVTVNGTAVTCATSVAAPTTCTIAAAAVPASANIAVAAQTLSGTTTATAVAGGLTNSQTADPVAFSGAVGAAAGTISLTWANNPLNKNNVAGLNLIWTDGPAAGKTFPATSTGVTLIGLTAGKSYSFTLQAVSKVTAFNSAVVGVLPVVNGVVAATTGPITAP